MQTMSPLQTMHKDQRYLVVGLGMTGYSAACYLLQLGYQCKVQDNREQPPYLAEFQQNFPSVEVIKGELSEFQLSNIDCLVVSPGLSIRSPLMQKVARSGKQIMGDIELFAQAVNKPVLAITGSNGKSTVTSLLGEMIKADGKNAAVGGNIGVPALQLLSDDVDFYVLELSSFQLETTSSLRPLISTVLNVSEDHMDRYENLKDYQQCKKSIYSNAINCLSNFDDASTRQSPTDIQFSLHNASCEYTVTGTENPMLAVDGEGWINTTALKLKGRHNWANCLAAIAMARVAGISKPAILKALESYAGLPHRSEWIAEINGVSWINDSKATNPGATKAAIEGLDEPVILLAGGQSKGANVAILCESLSQHVKTVLLFGQDADVLQQSWNECVNIQRVDNLEQAVQIANQIAVTGDIVLLAPACASFDMYSGFPARGDHFKGLVRALS
ncbi:UDP-N-acetylmuramoyl-L-alanine--D-glutamate ligase [bacterium]|nr:MAG: UDP-N-acetylmuramoyl-L-alanine--D-glutamate ligase [bacterium]